MFRSFSIGSSGMKSSQTRLDVSSANIANSNTIAYKSQSVNYSDSFSETVSDAMGATRNTGGKNAEQITLGAQVSSINTNIAKGSLNPTGRNLDVAITKEGFYFMVANGKDMFNETDCIKVDAQNHSIATVPTGTSISYTRDGSFHLDDNGDLLTSDGHKVLGYSMIGRTKIGSGSTDYADVVSISRNQGSSTVNYGAGDTVATSSDAAASLASGISLVTSKAAQGTANGPSSYIGEGDVAFVSNDALDLRADGNNFHTLRVPNSVKKFYKDSTGMHVKSVKVKTVNINSEGLITAVLDDNTVAAIGQIGMATFKNPEGLTKEGSNLLSVSPNSGDAIIRSGSARSIDKQTDYNKSIDATNNSAGFADMQSGALEESNVDLATEFTNLIVASRSYQADAKIISTGDEMLQTLVNIVK